MLGEKTACSGHCFAKSVIHNSSAVLSAILAAALRPRGRGGFNDDDSHVVKITIAENNSDMGFLT